MTGNAAEIITFLLDADKKQLFDLEPHKEKRRLTQNAYYWKLLELIAIKTHISKAELHNINLRHLGLIERVGNNPVYVMLEDTEKVEKQTLQAETYHLAPRRETKQGKDGKTYRYYVMLRGSSDYNVQEFSALVDMAIQDAKEQGIEVLSKDELEHIRELERNNERRMAHRS